MKSIAQKCKYVIVTLFFSISFSAIASDLPDPEVLAKQYLKDLCTLNEQDFTRKYMLTQLDAEGFMKDVNKAYTESGERPSKIFSDSLAIRSEVHSLVVKSYRAFKEWQHENEIDSSKIKYLAIEFEIEKKRKLPFYTLEDLNIFFSCDTMSYVLSCDDFVYLKTKWIGGDFDGVHKVDKYLNTIYEDYDYVSDAVVDTIAAVDYEYVEEESYENTSGYVYELEPPTKKQLKIQKKIDAYNRKIDALIKKYE